MPVYGCFQKKIWENPQIIHFNRAFHYFHHPFGVPLFLVQHPYFLHLPEPATLASLQCTGLMVSSTEKGENCNSDNELFVMSLYWDYDVTVTFSARNLVARFCFSNVIMSKGGCQYNIHSYSIPKVASK